MAKYAIGLDGGGTKTEVAMLSAQGETIYMGRLGPLNPVSYPDSPAKIAEELARFIDADCAAICVACAGAADKAKAEGVKRAMDGIFAGPVFVRTDGENSLYTALGERDGVALISGTGSICYAQKGGATARSGGRGHVLDDAGSAYAIGRDILSAVIRASDGMGEPTALSEAVFELCGTDDIAAITARYTACPKSEIAALAPLISSHAEDAIAGRIEATAAEELSLMAAAVTKKLELSAPSIALMGGTLLHQPRLCALTAERIRARVKDARCFLCDKSAAVGAGEFALARGG